MKAVDELKNLTAVTGRIAFREYFNPKPPPVAHYIDGRSAWRVGIGGIFLRWRGLLIPICIGIVLLGAYPWWWRVDEGRQVPIHIYDLVIGTCIIITFLYLLILIYLRSRTIRSLDIKYYLHRLAHDLRDNQTKLYEKLELSEDERNVQLKSTLTQICDRASKYFQLVTGDHDIGACIRLAALESDSETKEPIIVFKTIARSSGYNPQRKKTSQPIKITEGMPRFLQHNNNQGVLIYYDLERAAELGAFKPTHNDLTFRDEIVNMMVSPLSAWDGKNQSLVGLMFITSRNPNVFQIEHVDSLLFLSDLTAVAIAQIMQYVRLKTTA